MYTKFLKHPRFTLSVAHTQPKQIAYPWALSADVRTDNNIFISGKEDTFLYSDARSYELIPGGALQSKSDAKKT